jgi:hypothetical protein
VSKIVVSGAKRSRVGQLVCPAMAHHFYMMNMKVAISTTTLAPFIHKRASSLIAQKHGVFFRGR